MSYNPSTQQILASLNRRLNSIDRSLEFEDDKRENMMTLALVAVNGIGEHIEKKAAARKVKDAAKNIGFNYDKKSDSFYKSSSKGVPLKIDFEKMSMMYDSAVMSGDPLGGIIFGKDIDGKIDYSKEDAHHMSFDELQKHMDIVNKKDKWWMRTSKYERSEEILDYGGCGDKSAKYIDQINLAGTDALKQINDTLGTTYGNMQEYYDEIQANIDQNVKSGIAPGEGIDLAKLGQYDEGTGNKDTQLAIIGGKLSHVTRDEALMIAMNPAYADYMWEQAGRKPISHNDTTGLPQYGALGTAGSAVMSAFPVAGALMMGADMFIGANKAAEAATRKIKQIDESIGLLADQTQEAGKNKVNEAMDVYEQGETALEDLQMQSTTSAEQANAQLAEANRKTGGLNVGSIESKRENVMKDIAQSTDRQSDALNKATEKQVTTLADQYDQQISDIAMNVDDLKFQQAELRKQDSMWENLL